MDPLTYGQVIGLGLTAAFGAWAGVVGLSARSILTRLDKLAKSVADAENRLTRLETRLCMLRDQLRDGK